MLLLNTGLHGSVSLTRGCPLLSVHITSQGCYHGVLYILVRKNARLCLKMLSVRVDKIPLEAISDAVLAQFFVKLEMAGQC